jgi:hypothetical protein
MPRALVESEIVPELERKPRMLASSATELAAWMVFRGRVDQAVGLLERASEASLREGDTDRAVQLEAHLLRPIAARPCASAL